MNYHGPILTCLKQSDMDSGYVVDKRDDGSIHVSLKEPMHVYTSRNIVGYATLLHQATDDTCDTNDDVERAEDCYCNISQMKYYLAK